MKTSHFELSSPKTDSLHIVQLWVSISSRLLVKEESVLSNAVSLGIQTTHVQYKNKANDVCVDCFLSHIALSDFFFKSYWSFACIIQFWILCFYGFHLCVCVSYFLISF